MSLATNRKGTSRFSNNDKKLVRELWVSNKNNAVEKRRVTRSLSNTEKIARQLMPTERAETAVKQLRKKQKKTTVKFEASESDSAILAICVQDSTFLEFAKRQAALAHDYQVGKRFDTALRTDVKKRKPTLTTRDIELALGTEMSQAHFSARSSDVASSAQKSIRFPQTLKHQRLQNYLERRRQSDESETNLLTISVLRQVPDALYDFSMKQKQNDGTLGTATTATKRKRVALSAMFLENSVQDECIDIECDACGQVLPSKDAVTNSMLLFYHAQCIPMANTSASAAQVRKFM